MEIVGRSRLVWAALLVTSVFVLSAPPTHAGFLGKLKKKVDQTTGKVDRATEKVTRPVDEANAQIDETVGEATRPITEAQRKMDETQDAVTRPMDDARRKMDDASTRVTEPVRRMKNSAGQIRQAPDTFKATAQAKVQGAKYQAMRPVTMTQQKMAATQNPMAALRSQLTSAARLTDSTFGRDVALRRFKLDALAARDGKTLRLTGTVATNAQKLRAQQLAQRNFKTVVNEIRVVPAAVKKPVAKKM